MVALSICFPIREHGMDHNWSRLLPYLQELEYSFMYMRLEERRVIVIAIG